MVETFFVLLASSLAHLIIDYEFVCNSPADHDQLVGHVCISTSMSLGQSNLANKQNHTKLGNSLCSLDEKFS